MCKACDEKSFGTPNVDRIRLWAQALISGEFEQGVGYLRTVDDTYCCLGVACAVAARNGGPIDDLTPGANLWNSAVVDQWFGTTLGNINLSGDPERRVFPVQANDDLSWSFRKIAEGLAATFGFELEETKNAE